MKTLELRLKEILSGFTFSDVEPVDDERFTDFFGVKEIPKRKYRDSSKNLIRVLGYIKFFVSRVTYIDNPTMDSFRYMIIWTDAECRQYQCKNFNKLELNKKFISGKTDDILLNKLQELIDSGEI